MYVSMYLFHADRWRTDGPGSSHSAPGGSGSLLPMVGGERERPPRELGIAGVAPDRMRVRIGREPRVVVPERAEPVPFPAPWVANSFDASTSNLDAWSFAELAPTHPSLESFDVDDPRVCDPMSSGVFRGRSVSGVL
jgi:hypothetical protein